MKQGVGFSMNINIIAIFLIIIFAFLAAALSYYKAYKINNVISASIEKYDGFNKLSQADIETKLTSLGYVNGNVTCQEDNKNENYKNYSYCVYRIAHNDRWFKMKIVTFMTFDIPIINQRVNIPVTTSTRSILHYSN